MPELQWSSYSSSRPPFRFTDELTASWMLVTSGKPGDLGTMTVSWGGSGFIWNHDVVFLVIRESRNTLSYLKRILPLALRCLTLLIMTSYTSAAAIPAVIPTKLPTVTLPLFSTARSKPHISTRPGMPSFAASCFVPQSKRIASWMPPPQNCGKMV